ncbi:hypothetical protein COJ85_27770 [Bacillus sp. AFS076308]|uniref:hypothetical protein n=1 Tax=unclassified Bacillus (in: firmicutes) TaxID=185979 RepID=UPI000BF556A9|nr:MULTISPECIES: hypothetical protein [unclassified Bacillus (in: firmicutes)]PFN83304.1 hypothetical protein COJ85_27770 [Bacillus sp. AFS076308]PGV48709.1 hypothetical protein COD92_25140 [Bacillus sp. AFS037270]
MPSVINLGIMNINSLQPSSAVFVGEGVVNGMDANRKYNLGMGGVYGVNNITTGNLNNIADSFEMLDGVIFDQDLKPNIGGGGNI